MSKSIYKSDKIRTLVAVGMFSALAYVCCVVFHFKLAFLSFDLKDAVMMIGGMLLGPIYGAVMAVIVSLVEMLTISSTQLYGFIMNIISSISFVCVGSFIYSRKRTLGGALLGVTASIIAMPAVMMPANLLITPHYYGVSVEQVVNMIPTLLLPFNITKAVFNASVVFLLYKPFSKALRFSGFSINNAPSSVGAFSMDEKERSISAVTVTVIAILVAVLTLFYFFVVLKGVFTFA